MKRENRVDASVLDKPTTTPEELYELGVLPLGRNGIYDAIARGELEAFRIGRAIILPTAPIRRKLGLV